MKRNSFNMLFFIKKAKLLKSGEASVCMRITVNGARVETNIRKSIDPASWNQAKECPRGKSRKSCDLNAYIEDAKIKLHQIFKELEEQRQLITARLLQEKFFGQDKEPEEVRTLHGESVGRKGVERTFGRTAVDRTDARKVQGQG